MWRFFVFVYFPISLEKQANILKSKLEAADNNSNIFLLGFIFWLETYSLSTGF